MEAVTCDDCGNTYRPAVVMVLHVGPDSPMFAIANTISEWKLGYGVDGSAEIHHVECPHCGSNHVIKIALPIREGN